MNKKSLILYIFLVAIVFSALSVKSQETALSVSDALEKALENNYGIIISKSEIEIAKINNNWGTAGRIPTVGFDVSSINNKELLDNTSTNMISGGIGVNWTIFNGFKVNITKDKLERLENLTKGRSAVVVESTIQDVIMSYYNILLQKEQLEVLKTVMQLSKDRFDYEQVRHEIGGSVTYNVLLAKNIYLNDKALYLNQEVVVRNTIRNFNFLVGEEPQITWTFSEEFNSDTTEYILGDLMDKMLANNQTLQNQYANLLLQKNEIDLQRSNLYPRLSLSAGIDNSYSWINSEGQAEIYNEALTPYGNVSLSYDIYSAGNRKRAINIAKINEEITQVETDEIKHSLTNQLYNEFETYNLRKVLLNVANESLEAAEMNLQIADEKFKSGAINSFNYRDIQLSYLRSAINQLQSVYNLIYSNTTLTRLTGGFLDEKNP
ncbi:MAG: TolC family protein [Bacteroidales bacterium]|nr:TolC family protein [Bacteroidales bacterium]